MTDKLNFGSPLKVYQTNQRTFSNQAVQHPKLDVVRPHYGDDLNAYKGQPVYASETGKIDFRENPGGFGHYVVIDHGQGYQTKYGHLDGFNLTITT